MAAGAIIPQGGLALMILMQSRRVLQLPIAAAVPGAGLSSVSEPGIHVTHDYPVCPADISGLSGTYRSR
ncbi:MAG: hypothetical protein JWO93_2322 [Micrococcaceae bacterium]|nr:hypothetical protein [Micrococcaceae bacterium]